MSDRETDDLLAAELVFGLLDGAERGAAEQRAIADPEFAEHCAWWRARAFAMLDGREEAPPSSVWAAIMPRLPANENTSNVRRWQAATAIAASLALVLGAALLTQPSAPPVVRPIPVQPVQMLVAVLASPERDDVVAVDYDPARRRLSVLPAALDVGTRAAELWVIPAGGAPVSLGVLAVRERTLRVASAPVAALVTAGSTLAISLEPQGGSPTGAPTGPVILTGKIARS